MKLISFVKSESMKWGDNPAPSLYVDRYIFERGDSGSPMIIQCCTEYPTYAGQLNNPVFLALYVDGQRVNHNETVLALVKLIPEEQYVKDLLRGHEAALYIRDKGLR